MHDTNMDRATESFRTLEDAALLGLTKIIKYVRTLMGSGFFCFKRNGLNASLRQEFDPILMITKDLYYAKNMQPGRFEKSITQLLRSNQDVIEEIDSHRLHYKDYLKKTNRYDRAREEDIKVFFYSREIWQMEEQRYYDTFYTIGNTTST